jgi:hypothetical protein
MVGPLSTADQEKLLLPFEQLRGVACRQEVTFAGAFDPALVQRVTQAMIQRVAWLRAGAAEIYDITLSIKRMGDWVFNMGNADMALAKWEDTHNFLENAFHHNDMVRPPIYKLQVRHTLTSYRWASV